MKKMMRCCIVAGMVLVASTAHAATIDVRCPRLPESSKSELEARAQLLLSSAKMSSASVTVECEADRMWLIWFDGRRLQIDTSSGMVEGSLDAIEDFLVMDRHPREAKREARPADSSTTAAAAADGPLLAPAPRSPLAESTPQPDDDKTRGLLEGGVVVSTLTEWWDGSMGIGPRFEVGVRFGQNLALVLAEGARFGVGSSSETLALDLQGGVAFGAPYTTRTGLGFVLLGGAERVASNSAGAGWYAWRATGSLGLRFSGAVGSVDLWSGPEIIVRSGATEMVETSIPQVSGIFSVGCLFPAFGIGRREPAPLYAVEQ
jgi:hypothetical protein